MSDVKKTLGYLSRQKLARLSEKLKERAVKAAPEKIGRRPNRSAPCPLSFAQLRLWFLDQLAPNSSLYNIPAALRLDGRLDLEVLERVINEIVKRHEILRTRFDVVDGEPLQVIEDWKIWRLEVTDLTGLPPEEREAEAGRVAISEAGAGFDLSRGPLLRCKVLKLEEWRHVVFFTMHHIVSDAWSMRILIREIGTLYRAYSMGDAGDLSPLDEAPIQYADFAVWQRGWLQGETLERELEYWRKQLHGMEVLELPADRPRAPAPSYRGGSKSFVIERGLAEKLKALAQREGVTMFMALLGGFDILMSRYSGQEDVALGTDIANRNRVEIAGLIGFFVNQLVLRVDVRARESFSALLKRVKEVCLEAYAHQDLPFEKLVEELEPGRDLGRSPLFQVKLIWQNAPREELILGETRGIGSDELQTASESQTAKFDLTVAITDTGDDCPDLVGTVSYSRDLFEEETIERLISHYANLLREVVRGDLLPDELLKDGERSISDLSLLGRAEREQILVGWNDTGRRYPQDLCIHELFERQVENKPAAIAIVHEDQQLSYAELNARANKLAHHLRGLGVGPETLVGIYAERSVEMVAGLLAILKAGGGYIPLDPAYPVERLIYMLEDSKPVTALTHAQVSPQIRSSLAEAGVPVIDLEADAGHWAQRPTHNPETGHIRLTPRHLAYVIYTSGSTGRPKGVMNEHRGVVNRLLWMQDAYDLKTHDAVLQKTPFSFDVSVWEFFWPLLNGGKLVMARAGGHRDPAYLTDVIREQQITMLHFVPSMLQVFLEYGEAVTCSSLTQVICSGEALPGPLARRFKERLGHSGLHNLYGPTEAAVDVTFWACPSDIDQDAIPIGRPVANTQIYLLDSHGQPAPVGITGEIHIGGVQVARGYLNRPDLTAERFVACPFTTDPDARMYRTGDLGRYLPNGEVEYLGRNDFQVKIRGLRIELGEIEAALLQHQAVREAVVVARQDAGRDNQLVAYLVSDNGEGLVASGLRAYLKQKLPEYMAPAAFVMLEKMPQMSNGKLDRQALPAPSEDRVEGEAADDAPRTPVEEILAGLFRKALKLQRVGVRDNFFEIGGHSLLATRVVSQLRNTFGLNIGVRGIFEDATVEGLSRRIEQAMRSGEKDEAPPLVRISREGHRGNRLPLSFAQQRLWFLDQLAPNNPFYNIPGALRLEGRLDSEALERVINEIVRRHETLRTRFEVVDGELAQEPVQVIEEWAPRSLEVTNLTALPMEEREEEAKRIGRAEAETGFDLSRGPLLRVKVLKLGEEQHVLLFTMSHIVSDGWSTEILIREVGTLYRAYLAGEPSPLDEAPIQYADFAVWQRAWLQGETLEGELNYWRKQLEGMEALELPADRSRPATPSYRGAERRFLVERELAEKLRALSHREGVTMFMALLGGLDVLMSRYSGQEDVALGTDIANRNRAEIEGLIGFFVNQLVLRVKVGASDSFSELLKRVRDVCLGAYAHQDVPFEKLVEELQPERDLSRSPLFQVKLIWENAAKESLELEGLRLSGSGYGVETARIDLTVAIKEADRELIGSVVYSRDLFEEETIERLMGHYLNVLRWVVEGSERPICLLSLLSEAERKQIVVEWNETSRPYPDDLYVHHLFAEQANRNPERIALMNEGRQLSYGALDRRANQLARYLRRLGVGPEAVVGLCLERSIEMVVAVMGALKAGGAYLPLDPEYPLERVALMLEDAGAGVVLTRRELEDRLPAFWGQTVCLDQDWERIGEESESEPESGVVAENLAYVIYTSGSTGRPKGVMISHGGLSNYLQWATESYRIEEGEGAPVSSSIGFDLTVTSLYGPLVSGKCVNLLSEKEGIEALGRSLREESGYSLVKITPAHLELLAQQMSGCEVNGRANALVIGGEELRAKGLKFWQERARGTRLINEYGPTETVVGCCVYEVEGTESGREGPPIGRPIANMRMYVLDEELEPAPVGVRGEIYISGVGVARGYLGKPELTGERFIPDGLGVAGVRAYRTGDVGRYLSDGNIEYVGRVDRQVKVRGYRIELGEIETALDESRLVRRSVVEAVEDESGGKRLVGYVVGEEGATAAELKRHLRERLPEYMIPEAIVMLEEMPLSANGKVDRKRLPVIKDGGRQVDEEYVRARTPIEELVVGIFEDVLKLDGIGVADNFFEIGGHSLLATQVISRVRKSFGVEIGVGSIFEKPTVEGLANRIEEAMRSGGKDEAPPLVHVSREGERGNRLPLSFAQKRLWFIDQLEPGTAIYNLPGAVRLEGELDLDALERVINEIIRRHEVLRTRFEFEGGEPVQVIDAWESRKLEVEDLTSLTPEERSEKARQIAIEETRTGFNLSHGPLLRVKLLKLEEEQHLLLHTLHHIVGDGWSMNILSREVEALYRAFSAGEPSPLAELPIQYVDFAVWQKTWLQGEALEAELEYWRSHLAGMEALELPTDYLRPQVQSYRGAGRQFLVETELVEKLRALSHREGVTLFMTLLAAFELLLMRYSGQADVAVGTDIANRNRAEIEGLIGFFVNQLVLRVKMKARESFSELLKRVREVCLGAYAHQDLPFEKLVEELQPERDLGRSPLFQVKLIWQNASAEGPELGGMRLSDFGMGETQAAKLDLTLAITDTGRALVGAVEYSRDLFEGETIGRLINHYTNVLSEIVSGALGEERAISELSLLSEVERKQIVVEWNETSRPYPDDLYVHHLFTEQANRNPERIALMNEGRQLSYGALDRRASQLARYLRRLGVGPESVVGLCLERSIEMVVAVMGALKAGGAYLPLDPEYPLERVALMLEDAGAGVVLTRRELEDRLPAFWGQTVCLDQDWERIGEESESEPESGVVAENLAYVIYTSGSTGRPKGVMISHGGLSNYLQWATESYRIEEGEGAPVSSSIGFDLTVTSLYGPLVSGKCVNLLSEKEGIEALGRSLREESGYSLVKITPAHLELLAQQMSGCEVNGRANALVIGGEELRAKGLKFWQERARGTRLINEYGPTETVVGCCVYEVEGTESGREATPIGRPIANTRMYVLDEELEPAPVGVRGEIYISGVGVARGYLGKPELTGERFIPDGLGVAGVRAYRTGDVGRYLSDGNIEYVGRVDRQVKVRGYRIELGEIETALDESRLVRRSVVEAVEDERGGKRLVGYVVGEEGATAAELKRHLRERLPEYMVPEAMVMLEEMPLSANGKVDRKRLPLVKDEDRRLEQERVGARTPIEEMLIGIFEEVLKVDRIGIYDNFFELGGHSLLAAQVASRVANMFGVEIGVRSIFEQATIAGLASRIEKAMKSGERAEAPPLVKASRTERLPLSFAQQRLWFIDQLDPGNAAYNIPAAARLEGRLNLEVLERSINEIVRRHEVLRTKIEVVAGEPVQVIDAWEPRRLRVEDLTNLTCEEKEAEVSRLAREEAETGFDLSRGPLLRIKVLKLEEDNHVALFTMSHIVSDGWSTEILIREVGTLYQAYSAGESSPLQDLPIQYADYAVWQREYLVGEVLEGEIQYWKEQLKGAAVMDLPTDHARPPAPSYRAGVERIKIGKEISQEVKRLGQREGATLFMTLMAAFKALLMRYSREEDIVVGTPIANRAKREVEGLIGFFVNTLVLRTDLGGNPSFREVIRRVRGVALEAYGRQDAPFEKLVEEINPDRDLSRSPLFQVLMSLQNTRQEDFGGGLKASGIGEEAGMAKFDLTLDLTEGEEGILGALKYSLDLYEEKTIRRMARHFEKVVEEIARDAEQKVREIVLISEEEKRQIIELWDRTEIEYARSACIHQLFEEQMEKNPEVVAVICEADQISYRELNRRANQLGHYLKKMGVRPEAMVGVCLERSIEMVIAMMGVWKAGGVYVPMDPSYPTSRLRSMMGYAGAEIVVTGGRAREQLQADKVRTVDLGEERGEIERCPEENPASRVEGENLAYVIYTSGSTGEAKGVMVSHRNVSSLLEVGVRKFGFEAEEEMLCLASFSFDISLFELLNPLIVGGKVNIVSRERILEMRELLEEMKNVNVIHAVPTLMREVIEGIRKEGEKVDGYKNIKKVFVGGELVPTELLMEMKEVFKEARIEVLYGPTEGTIICSGDTVGSGAVKEKNIIGRPLKNAEIRICDEYSELVPIGVRGELGIGGNGVARGYLNRPELTAGRFIPDPYSIEPGLRMYWTGDLGRYEAEGGIEFLGRSDDQVKVRGYRIEPKEVETVLNEHGLVKRSVVIAREDEKGDRRLVGYVVVEEGATAPSLKRYLRERLPEYMVPSAIVVLEEMPLMPNGKLDRRALPTPDSIGAAREYEAPVGATETILAQIWAEVLKLERVGRDDHFFELGGHSLLGVRLIERMRRAGLHTDVRTLFTTPTLAALAAAVVGESDIVKVPPNLIPHACEAITPEMLPLARLNTAEIERIVNATPGGAANVQDIYPLAPLQEGILFHHLVESGNDPYLLHSLYSFDTRGRLDWFLRAMQKVIDRHDILRTAVMWEGLPEPVQVVWRRAEFMVEELSLDPATGGIAEQLLEDATQRRQRIDVRRAPLMRARIARDEPGDRWIMLHQYHHLLGDHTALEALLQEIQWRLLGQEWRLDAPLPFRNFVAQARMGMSREEHESFFRGMLGDVDEPTAPYGLINAQRDGSGIREARREIDAHLASRLRQQARTLGVSTASLFHLAWALVLASVSERDDVVFGTVLFGRMGGDEGVDHAPGMFINTLPIRIRIGGDSVRESVRQTHILLAQLLRHEHASLALAQRCSAVAAPTPLFSALLNYRHSAVTDPTPVAAGAARSAWEGIEFLRSEERTNYPFNLSVDDLGEGFTLNAQVESPVDPNRICAYVSAALEKLAEALEQAPATPVRGLNVLPASERHELLVEWNATSAEYPYDQCVHALFEAQAARTPDAIAVVNETCQLSYNELNASANRLAHELRALGVKPDTRVAVLLERSIDLVLAELAVLKCGAAYVSLDQNTPIKRQALMIEDCQAGVALTVNDLELSASAGVKCVNLNALRLEERAAHNPALPLESEMPAYVIYTSGSTGQPKGVVVPHRAIGRLTLNNRYAAFEANDRVAFTSNPAFDASTMEVWAPLLHGGCVVVIPQSVLLEPSSLVDLVCQEQINILHLVAGLLNAYAEPLAPIFPKLRYLLTGGDLVDPRAVAKVLSQGPPQRLIHCYGPSESTTFATTHEVTEIPEGAKSIPIGQPIANTQTYILDRRLEIVPVGVPGELYIGGKGVVHGYLGQPEMTAERFLPDSFSQEAGARLYKTGDLARYLADGKIEFLGRIDHQVKIRGYRIELGEIEARLSSHPAVRQCVVIAHEIETGEKRLGAYLVCDRDLEPSASEIRSYLKERLPEYMLPTWFVLLDEMPLTPNGKVDRQALTTLEVKWVEERAEYVAPRTATEEILVGIFQEVLKLDRVGVHDNFFEIGGHSLLATQVISRVRNTFEIEIEVGRIFEEATVAELAETLIAREPEPGQTEKIAIILKRLNSMTDEDVDAELAAMKQ